MFDNHDIFPNEGAFLAYLSKITTVPLEFTTKNVFEMPRKKLHRSRKNFNTVGKTSPPLEKLHQRGKNFIDLRGHFWWSFSNPLVLTGDLLGYNILPYGILTTCGSPDTTLLVVENRLRKVWGRFSTIRCLPIILIIHFFFALNLLYKIPQRVSDRTKIVDSGRFLARKSRFYKNRYHRRRKNRSELPIHFIVR